MNRVQFALGGGVLVNTGQVTPDEVKALKRAVRAGQLISWRGKWFPEPGAAFGIGPDKVCWSTPETAARFVKPS